MLQYHIFIILSPLVAVILGGLLIAIWRTTGTRGVGMLRFYLLTSLGYLITNSLELITKSPAETLLCAQLGYIFITTIPVFWLGFSLQLTGKKRLLKPYIFWLFFVIPIASFILAVTNSHHQLIWQNYHFVPIGRYLTMRVISYGDWVWASAIQAYILLFGGAVLIAVDYFSGSKLYRQQSGWIFFGTAAVILVNAVYQYKLIPGLVKDFTPIGFALGGLAFVVGIFKYRLLNISPAVRNALMNKSIDGMLFVDAEGRIAEINPVGTEIISTPENPAFLGQPVERFPLLSSVLGQHPGEDSFQQTLKIGENDIAKHYDMLASTLYDKRREPLGVLCIFHDITERMKLIEKLQTALSEIKALRGIVPICAGCKKIRDDEGYWHQVEEYVSSHSDVEFSHSLCPDCLPKYYPEYQIDETEE